MKLSSKLWGSVALSLMLILSGCAKNGFDSRIFTDIGDRQGKGEAGVEDVRQPDECGKKWSLLRRDQLVGSDRLSGVARYEDYIENRINPQKIACFNFNENVNKGLSSR